MITLHRPQTSALANEIEEIFSELTLNYKIYVHDPSKIDAPWIEDDKEGTVCGREAIDDYLFRLRTGLEAERAITGDACYIDPETGEQC